MKEGLEQRWAKLRAEKPPADDVAAGRRWVAAYVSLVHWAEAVHGAAERGGDAHAVHAGEAHAAPAHEGEARAVPSKPAGHGH